MFCRLPRIVLAFAATSLILNAARTTLAEAPTVVYRWDAERWLTTYNKVQFTASPIDNADGTKGAQVIVTPRDAENPYNHIVVSAANLKAGNQYTAAITFSVAEPTKYPTSFYMFARHSSGNQHDIWRTWIGLPGAQRTITLPLDLKDIPGGSWKLFMGISKSGGLNIASVVVYSGLTSDGTTPFTVVPPTADAPLDQLPDRVSVATGATPFTIAPPAAPAATISLAQYNFVADAPGAPESVAVTNAASVQQALLDCKSKGSATLVIPPGTYRIAAANNIAVDGTNDLTIDGQGAVLIAEKLTKEGPFILIKSCSRVVVKNLVLDWDWAVQPIASLGKVTNLSADKTQCDFTFADLDGKQTELTRTTPWRGLMEMDPATLYRSNKNIVRPDKKTVIESGSAPNILHVNFPAAVALEEGKSYCIRHLYYEMGAFKVANCTDLSFNGVDIRSMPGMGWFFNGLMQNFEVVNCKIARAPGSRYPLTTAADGLHVAEFVSNLKVDHVNITGAGDDAMNIHNECYQGNLIPDPADPTKVTLEKCPSYLLRLQPGDPVAFYNADYSQLDNSQVPVTRQVATTSSKNGAVSTTYIQFTEPIPATVTALSIVHNARFTTSNVSITNCDMQYTNGRGILLSAENATVSDCRFQNVFSNAMNLETDIVQPLWSEGRGTTNLLIKNNTFEDCNVQGRYNGAIINADTHLPWGPTTTPLYRQLTIENNRFINCPGPALWLMNGLNVIVRSNDISTNRALPNAMRNSGALFVTDSADLALEGNKWSSNDPATPIGGVVYNPATTTNLRATAK